jgi:DNA-binding LacI/PurR family transcriptional regulator
VAVTITDVARAAGISKSTVSQYLNGRYEFMSYETRQRIKQVIEDLDYRPNTLARSLKQKKTHTIAALVSSILNPFITNTIRGAEDYCKENGFNLILCNADDDPQQELAYIHTLAAKQIDGVIISTTGRNNGALKSLNASGTPVVLFSRYVPEIGADTVSVNNRLGVELGIRHLMKLGHRQIAFFVLPFSESPVTPRRERAQAYCDLMQEYDALAFHPEWLVETDNNEQALSLKLDQLLSGGSKPTALFGANDLMTMSLVRLLANRGIRIPEDMAVLGFDDWEWAPYLQTPITVVAQPSYEMGRRAVERLIQRIQGGLVDVKPLLEYYEPELIVRSSCGEVKNQK